MKKFKFVNESDANLITHNGTFHADEVFATIILSYIIDSEEVGICRTNEVTNFSAFVYDIGNTSLDHHQENSLTRANGIHYSSFGLVWLNYGRAFLEKMHISEDAYELIDKDFVMGIDAIDNGEIEDLEIFNIANIIDLFNPNWNEEQDSDSHFLSALAFADNVFWKLIKKIESSLMAKEIVKEKLKKSKNHLLILDTYVPWKKTLFEIENDIWLVIYPANRGGYQIQTVPISYNSFASIISFPSSWGGKRDEELQNICGIPEATFCHKGLFLMGTKTLTSAIEVANKVIALNEK